MFTQILIGLVLVAIGATITIKANTVYDWFGSMDFADKYLGAGGSRLMYRLMGIILCLVGFMVATNLWSSFLQATLGSWLNLNPKNGLPK
ncbi:MAG: hypothetical protein PHS79_00150 [Patescibacteria group bacterium]|nr:hypothetical protein [Patescibacteria group bacterium]